MSSFSSSSSQAYTFTEGRCVAVELPSPPRQFDTPFPAIDELCLAQDCGQGNWYQAIVRKKSVKNPGYYIIVFVDTNETARVHEAFLRSLPPPTELGEIVDVHEEDNTYDVQLDNGKLMQHVSKHLLSKPKRWRPAQQRPVSNHDQITMWNDLSTDQFKHLRVQMPRSKRLSVSFATEETQSKNNDTTTTTSTATTSTSTATTSTSTATTSTSTATNDNKSSTLIIVADYAYVQLINIRKGMRAVAITGHHSSDVANVVVLSAPKSISNNNDKKNESLSVVSVQYENGDVVPQYPAHLLGKAPPPPKKNSFFGFSSQQQQSNVERIFPSAGQSIFFFHESQETGSGWKTGIVLNDSLPPMGIDIDDSVVPRDDLNKQVTIWQGDITTLNVDAIQNAANDGLWSGGGICGAIYKAANDFELSREVQRKYPNGCDVGKTVLSTGCQLHAKHVLHTVGPKGEKPKLLEAAYKSALDTAEEAGCKSVALCCISTGIFGFPPESAAPIAVRTVRKWLEEKNTDARREMKIIFCLFLDSDVKLYAFWMSQWFPKK
jgi:O-acetyl-ADP-ribose deacetylase